MPPSSLIHQEKRARKIGLRRNDDHITGSCAGKQFAKDILQELQFPDSIKIDTNSPCELLQACIWLMACTELLEAYVFNSDESPAFQLPLPYSILPECYSKATRTTPPKQVLHAHVPNDAWSAVEIAAHSAKRLHGKCEILQKQLQHECMRHATLEQQLNGVMTSMSVHATPYEGIVAESPALLQEHLDSFSALTADVRLRQAALELVPHFLQWAHNATSMSRSSYSVGSDLAPAASHHLHMPLEILQYHTLDLRTVRES